MENPMIYSAIVDAMGQINAIAKGRSNSMQNFKYRGIDDVMNELDEDRCDYILNHIKENHTIIIIA